MNKQIGILVLAIVLAIIAGVLVMNKNDAGTLPEKGILLDDLKANVAKLDYIQIVKAQGLNFETQLVDGQWLIADMNNYPVDKDKLATLLKGLVAAQKIQAKTSKVEFFERLGLQDISNQDSLATQVTLKAGQKTWSLLIGSSPERGVGQYVRFVGKNQTWLIDQTLTLPLSNMEWLKQPILPAELQAIQQVQRIGKKGWTIQKTDQEQSDFTMQNIPKGRLLKYPGVLNSVVSSLNKLNFEDTQPNDEALWQTFEPTLQFNITFFGGQTLRLELAKQDDSHYLRFSSDQVGKYWLNRIYQISSFSAQQLNKSLQDFLQEDKPELPMTETVTDEGEAPQ